MVYKSKFGEQAVSYTHLDVYKRQELNASIREKLDAYNARKFQKKECSRLSLFLGEEMPLLAPLPATPVSYTHLDVYKRQQ